MYYWITITVLIPVLLTLLYLRKNSKWCMGLVYAAGIAVFAPMLWMQYGKAAGSVAALIFPAKLFTVGVDYADFITMIKGFSKETSIAEQALLPVCSMLYVIAPFFTGAFILNYVRKVFDSVYLRLLFKRNVYVFSQFNKSSLLFAENLKRKNKKAVIIFAGSEKNPEYDMFRFVNFPIKKIYHCIPKSACVHMIFANTNEDEALRQFFDFKELTHKDTVEVYIYSTKKEAEYIIDEIKKESGKLKIQLINTEELLVLDTLWKYPLFMNMGEKKEFNITVFGVGNMGSSFIKDALWCTSLEEYDVKFNLVDRADAIKNLITKCPYIDVADYNFNIVSSDICSEKLTDIISNSNLAESNYIFISLGDDSLNVETAAKLRLNYMRMGKNPAIVTLVEDNDKREILEKVFKEENIKFSGNISQFCDIDYMAKHPIFKYGYEVFKLVQKHYSLDFSFEGFCRQNQTEMYSSLSNAVHMKYKIFAVMGNDFTFGKNKLKREIEENLPKLCASEHKRWVTFEKFKGYRGIEDGEMRLKFLKEQNKLKCKKLHKDIELKINLAMTSYEELDSLDKILREKYNKQENLKFIDELITRSIPDIWYKREENNV